MISASLENYLELIYNSLKTQKEVRAIDIANYFNISRPSVTEALIKLADNDFIIYEGRKGIKITKKGIQEATKIVKKHKILSDFFINTLGIEEKIANDNACRIEHVIDDEIIEKLAKLNKRNNEQLKNFF